MFQSSSHTEPKLRVITTQAPRRSFPLPYSPNSFFTGDLFDRLALFLHKHNTTFTSIECVARGIDKASALADGPTICICIFQDQAETRKVGLKVQLEEDTNEESREDIEANTVGDDRTEGWRGVAATNPPSETVGERGVDQPEEIMDDEAVDKEKEVEKSINEENDGQGKTEKKDSVEGSVEQQRGDHDQGEDVPNSEKTDDEVKASADCKDEHIKPCGRNPEEGQGGRQEKKPGMSGSDDDSTQSLAKPPLETKPEQTDKKPNEVPQPQTVEHKTNAYTSGIAKLFCKSDVANTVPPEILTVEFVSVILHEDGRVDT